MPKKVSCLQNFDGRKHLQNHKHQENCQSSFIIYLGTCQKCQGQYVGKSTQPFTRRHSGHKQEIKNQIGGLGQHYGGPRGCGYENLKMIIIEKVETGNNGLLGQREIFWQNQLRCFVENGGKAHCKRKEKWKQHMDKKLSFIPVQKRKFLALNQLPVP